MNEQEVLDYIARFTGGDPSKARYGIEYKEIDNPDPRLRDKPGQEKIRIPVETWRTPGGQIIFSGYRTPGADGQFTVVAQETPKAEPSQTSTPGQQADDTRKVQEQVERERNQAAGKGPYTDTELANATRAGAREDRLTKAQEDANAVALARLGLDKAKFDRESTTPQQGKDGRWYLLNADGTVKDVTPSSAAKPLGSLPADTHLGTVTRAVQAKLDEIYADPNLTEKEKLDRATLMVNAGDALLKETQSILTAQQTAFSNETTLRGQDLAETQSRRNFSQNVWDTAYKQAVELNKYQPAGSDTGFQAMLGQMLLGSGFAAANGGMRDVARPAMPQGLQQAQELGLPGMPAININVGTAAPPSVQAATQLPPAPPPAPPMPTPSPVLPNPAPESPDAMDPNAQYPAWLHGMMAA